MRLDEKIDLLESAGIIKKSKEYFVITDPENFPEGMIDGASSESDLDELITKNEKILSGGKDCEKLLMAKQRKIFIDEMIKYHNPDNPHLIRWCYGLETDLTYSQQDVSAVKEMNEFSTGRSEQLVSPIEAFNSCIPKTNLAMQIYSANFSTRSELQNWLKENYKFKIKFLVN